MDSKTGFNIMNCPNVSLMTVGVELQHLSYSGFVNAILDFEKLGQFGEILED